jgi:hypothetical protein
MFKKLGYATLIAITAVAFVIGSAATGEAKSKKKKAAPPPSPLACVFMPAPVCGAKGGHKYTYATACFAVIDGAKIVSQKACPVKKAKKAKKAKKKVTEKNVVKKMS